MSGDDETEITSERGVDGDDEAVPGDAETDDVADEPAERTGPASKEARSADAAADSFLEVERELDAVAEGAQIRGRAVDVERVPAGEVPDGFPYDVGADDALALTLEIDGTEGKTVTTYFAWPGDGADERLGKLLQLRDVPLDRFADLHGERILLEIEDGHAVPVLPREQPRGDDRAYWGVLAGLFPSVLIFLGGMLGAGGALFSTAFVLVWLFATFVVLPVSVYFDAWHLRTRTNWEGGPLFWAFLALVPGLNVVAVAAYLLVRRNAEPLV